MVPYDSYIQTSLTLFIIDTSKNGTLANSEDPDEGLHYLLK